VEFQKITTDDESLGKCAKLFATCFPKTKHLTADYLRWMYRDNPRGQVVGFNAVDKDEYVGHYACLPCEIMLGGKAEKSLLAILSTTHPDYQGQGLFPRLAEHTYAEYDNERFACVYGVGNANSTPSLVRKIGFQLVSPLEVKVGIGACKVDWSTITQDSQFRRVWTYEDLQWRAANQINPITIARNTYGDTVLNASSINSMIKVMSPVLVEGDITQNLPRESLLPKLSMGFFPKNSARMPFYLPLPGALKPSPLNMVYKPLHTDISQLDPAEIMFGFQDFDAY
jgi:GNAT superfamily N-acetyltransferase